MYINFQLFLNFLCKKSNIFYNFTTNKCWFSEQHLFSALIIINILNSVNFKGEQCKRQLSKFTSFPITTYNKFLFK